MSTRRRSRDHRRGKSVEQIAKEELMIIVDQGEKIDELADIKEECDTDMDEYNSHPRTQSTNQGLRLDSPTSHDMSQLIDEIDLELTSQYPSPHTALSRLSSTDSQDSLLSSRSLAHRQSLRRTRSDSHYAASTPLVVHKYTNTQLDSLVKSKKPRLMRANEELPLLSEIQNDERECINVILQKLSLCEVLCDFRVVNDGYDDMIENDHKIEQEIQCIANKKAFLKECTKYLTKKKWSSIAVLKQIFRTVQTNLFRSLPDSFVIAQFQGIDNPTKYTLPKWKHLQFIYELMFQVLMNKEIEKKTLCSYLCGQFLNNFVQLFHSVCKAEVDYVKILIHSMYMDFVDLRDEIRICLSQYCWDFIYCNNGTSDGINAILDIMNSILQGLDANQLNDPQKWYIVLCHVLCPLHKGEKFDKFEQTLYKCFKTFIKSKPEHFMVIFNHGLLKFWPKTNPSKELMFVKEILNVLKMVKAKKILCNDKFTNVFECVIEQIRQNLYSNHFKIVTETIDSFKDRLMRQCIDFHGGENGWKGIYSSLIYVTRNHYLYMTRDSSKQMCDWLKKYRITKRYSQVFEKLDSEYETQHNGEDRLKLETQRKQEREAKWEPIIIMANNNRNKLLHERKENKINKSDIAEIENIFDNIETKLANVFITENEREESSFKFDDTKLGVKKMSFHRLVNSQPMPEPDTPLKPVHKKRASQAENDYGYPQVHAIYKQYRDTKSENCGNPTHLVLFAKKSGIKGITFSITNKYFQARKSVIMAHAKTKSKTKMKFKPTAIRTSDNEPIKKAQIINHTNTHKNVTKFRRRKSDRKITSPIIKTIKNEKEKEKKLESNTFKMEEIKEDFVKSPSKTDFYEYAKVNNVDVENGKGKTKGSSTPATPGSLKSSPTTPVIPYWSQLNNDKFNLNSLVAKDLNIKASSTTPATPGMNWNGLESLK